MASGIWCCAPLVSSGCRVIFAWVECHCSPPGILQSREVAVRGDREETRGEQMSVTWPRPRRRHVLYGRVTGRWDWALIWGHRERIGENVKEKDGGWGGELMRSVRRMEVCVCLCMCLCVCVLSHPLLSALQRSADVSQAGQFLHQLQVLLLLLTTPRFLPQPTHHPAQVWQRHTPVGGVVLILCRLQRKQSETEVEFSRCIFN